MRSFKSFLVLGLMILLIGFTSNCKWLKSPFGTDTDIDNGDNGEEQKFATNVEIIYQRTEPYDPHDTVNLNIKDVENQEIENIEQWPLTNLTMEKISDQQFKYVVEKLPADIRLYTYVQDFGKSSAGENERNARIIIVNGTELTDIRDHHVNPHQIACFTIKEDGTVIP